MRRRIGIWVLAALLLIVPRASAVDQEPPHIQIIQMLYGEEMPELVILEGKGDEILSLELRQKPEIPVTHTFAGGLMLTGTAVSEARIITAVYTVSEKGKPIIWYDNETVVGASGIYQEEVPLQLLGEQKLLIAVIESGEFCGQIYTVSRKSEEIYTELLEYELNLYEEYGLS